MNDFYDNDDVNDDGWLCACGHWQEDGFHCTNCGALPPWGCECPICDARDFEPTAEDIANFEILNDEIS